MGTMLCCSLSTHPAETLPALSWETDLPEKADPCPTDVQGLRRKVDQLPRLS